MTLSVTEIEPCFPACPPEEHRLTVTFSPRLPQIKEKPGGSVSAEDSTVRYVLRVFRIERTITDDLPADAVACAYEPACKTLTRNLQELLTLAVTRRVAFRVFSSPFDASQTEASNEKAD